MSTYSPSLRIELIATGDQAGTWGNTTNTNLGTLIESAIAGYVSVSVIAANQALTALNGAEDQSRNMTIALTTTTGANFAVYAPPAEKTYVIYNASSYTATIYNSTVLGNTTAAGTGVAIPAGKTMTVWSEGTNFRVQNDHIIGTVVGNVTGNLTGNLTGNVTGNLAGNVTGNLDGNLTATAPTANTAASGTNTTQIATTAFVQSAITAAAAFPSGTTMMFVQTSAPTGWTKSTTHNDKVLRIVSGSASSGGTTAFSSVFTDQTPTISSSLSVGATTLTTAQMPSHTHSIPTTGCGGGGNAVINSGNAVSSFQSGAAGSGGSHTHSLSGSVTSSAITLNVQYVDAIIATKN
jgi:hypothetical protein